MGGTGSTCESPMSASTAENTGMRAGARAGTPQPLCVSSALKPRALRDAVFPPAAQPLDYHRTPLHVANTVWHKWKYCYGNFSGIRRLLPGSSPACPNTHKSTLIHAERIHAVLSHEQVTALASTRTGVGACENDTSVGILDGYVDRNDWRWFPRCVRICTVHPIRCTTAISRFSAPSQPWRCREGGRTG